MCSDHFFIGAATSRMTQRPFPMKSEQFQSRCAPSHDRWRRVFPQNALESLVRILSVRFISFPTYLQQAPAEYRLTFCSKSKVKCVHAGTSPCQRCHKSGFNNCVLSRPPSRNPKKSIRRAHTNRAASTSQGVNERERNGSSTPIASESTEVDDGVVDRHLTNLPMNVILRSSSVFMNKLPELAILNLHSFSKLYESARNPETKTLLAAILAVVRSSLSLPDFPWVESLLSSENYAVYARQMLSHSSFQQPKLHVAQALLVMTLYEWGVREFHRSWIYCGMTRKSA